MLLFFAIDIFVLCKWMSYKNKVEVALLEKEVNQKLVEYYAKKENTYQWWFIWCIVIDFLFFVLSF